MSDVVVRSQYRGKIAGVQVVGEELQRIAKANGERLTPEIVLRNAAMETSPLHDRFTWDNTEAAQQWRLWEASNLIRSVKVVTEVHPQDEPVLVRAFVNVSASPDGEDAGNSVYVPLKVALKVNDYRTQMLENAGRELESFRKKYSVLQELSGLFAVIDQLKHELVGK
jgi:hypothetical protein